MDTALIIIGVLLLLAGIGNLKRGRGGKKTQQGIILLLIGGVLLIIGVTWSKVTDVQSNPDPNVTETVIEQGKALGTIEPTGWFERWQAR